MQYTIALPANTNKTLALMMISGPHRNLPVIQQKILTALCLGQQDENV